MNTETQSQTRWIETAGQSSIRPQWRVIAPVGWSDEQIKDTFRPLRKGPIGCLYPVGDAPVGGDEQVFAGTVTLG